MSLRASSSNTYVGEASPRSHARSVSSGSSGPASPLLALERRDSSEALSYYATSPGSAPTTPRRGSDKKPPKKSSEKKDKPATVDDVYDKVVELGGVVVGVAANLQEAHKRANEALRVTDRRVQEVVRSVERLEKEGARLRLERASACCGGGITTEEEGGDVERGRGGKKERRGLCPPCTGCTLQ